MDSHSEETKITCGLDVRNSEVKNHNFKKTTRRLLIIWVLNLYYPFFTHSFSIMRNAEVTNKE